MAYEAPWRNRTHQLYEQYCYEDELPQKLRQLLKIEKKGFDDYWQYFYARHKRPQRQVVVRRPLWMTVSTTERFTDGSHRRNNGHQEKLVIIQQKGLGEEK